MTRIKVFKHRTIPIDSPITSYYNGMEAGIELAEIYGAKEAMKKLQEMVDASDKNGSFNTTKAIIENVPKLMRHDRPLKTREHK